MVNGSRSCCPSRTRRGCRTKFQLLQTGALREAIGIDQPTPHSAYQFCNEWFGATCATIEPLHRPPLLPWTSKKLTKRKKKRKTTKTKKKKKRQQRGRARTKEWTGQPQGPPKRFPRGRPETGQHLTKRHEATGGAVHLLACTAASMGDVHIDDFLFAMCVTLWGWDA